MQASWKNQIRTWIERTRGDKRSSRGARALASCIWQAHLIRSTAQNLPRLCRIWLHLNKNKRIPPSLIKLLLRCLPHRSSHGSEDLASPEERTQIAESLAAAHNRAVSKRWSPPPDLLNRLTRDGLVALPDLTLSPQTVERITQHLKQRPIYAAHIAEFSDQVPRTLQDPQSRHSPFGSYLNADVLNCPDLLELALHPQILGLAEGYLGCVPSLYSLHAWWSFPGHRNTGPQLFHRDIDDYRFLALFVYLTDVEGGVRGGEHEFIRGTHRLDTTTDQLGGDAELAREFFPPRALGCVWDETSLFRRVFGRHIQSVVGSAGSVFLADTYALHRGVRPTEKPRLVCWMRYGYRDNIAYRSTRTRALSFDWESERIPEDPYTRFVTRLLLARDSRE